MWQSYSKALLSLNRNIRLCLSVLAGTNTLAYLVTEKKKCFLYHLRQIIRLKVPFNIDPVVYATEYLQQALNDEGLP